MDSSPWDTVQIFWTVFHGLHMERGRHNNWQRTDDHALGVPTRLSISPWKLAPGSFDQFVPGDESSHPGNPEEDEQHAIFECPDDDYAHELVPKLFPDLNQLDWPDSPLGS